MAIRSSVRMVSLTLAFVIMAGLAQGCAGILPRRFESAEQAAQSLAKAVRTNDATELRQILGRDPNVLVSGDAAADAKERETFLKAYDEQHRVDATLNGYFTLVVGKDRWALPIPIVQDEKKGKWYFDSKAAKGTVGPGSPTTTPAT